MTDAVQLNIKLSEHDIVPTLKLSDRAKALFQNWELQRQDVHLRLPLQWLHVGDEFQLADIGNSPTLVVMKRSWSVKTGLNELVIWLDAPLP